ncbi:MAG: hypothetical protein NT018_02000 [Armatimonadetes bacterium]|nr:hypothetical protein [Armatimonadota bacterium]
MKASYRFLCCLLCLWALTTATFAQSAKVVRTIKSANPEPTVYNWHPHNRLGIERATFVGVKAFNRVLLREESGDVVEVPFFHFTARDLGELLNKMAKFPAETKVMDYTPSKAPIVDVNAAELKLGPVEKWPNKGVLGGNFCSLNTPPTVEDIQGRRAVHFDSNFWFYDTQYTAMVLDAMPANSLKENMPFTFSAWVLHPKEPDGDDPEMLISWHSRFGNNGTGLDWKRQTGRGDFYVMGIGGDLWVEPHNNAKPMMEWTHVAYVYTGGGLKGELRIYENGKLAAIGKSKYVPLLRDPVEITTNSVVLKGFLDTLEQSQLAYVRGYIGEYDAHHFGQLRHIGRWDQMNEIGLKPGGDFSIPFKDLKPGTKYYYRMFATENPESYENPGEPTRRWANGAGEFVTATADGKPGKLLPFDTDRYIFIGTQWGSRWYSSFSGPAGLFRGYISDLKLYDRALNDDEIRVDAKAEAAYDAMPANDDTIDIDKANFSWKSGISTAAKFRFYLDTDLKKVTDGTAQSQETTATKLDNQSQETTVTKLENVKLKLGGVNYWRVDTLDAGGKVLAQGAVWKINATYGAPTLPTPGNNSSMSRTGYFNWTQTIGTLKEQRFYLGSSAEEVAKATAPTDKFDGGRRDFNYPSDKLNFGATYYWRIESVMADDTVVPGQVWKFTVYNYFTAETDGRASEPFPLGTPNSRASRVMMDYGYPLMSTPRAPESDMYDIAHGTLLFLKKSAQIRNHLASVPCATTTSSQEGPPCVDGHMCMAYGGFPKWNMTMHEMGHQIQGGALQGGDPNFPNDLNTVFNLHADNNAWLGDYASANIWENMAVCMSAYISGSGREQMLIDDAPTYYLLSRYLPGAIAIDLHPAYGLKIDKNNTVLTWDNRGGVEDRTPGKDGYSIVPETMGTFKAAGSPKLETVAGASAIVFAGSDAFIWDRTPKYGFEKNRAFSVEFWARQNAAGSGDELLLGWGSEDKGVRIYSPGSSKVWTIGGNSATWPTKPAMGQWNHIIAIFEGGGLADGEGAMRLFVNGKEILTKSYKLNLPAKAPIQIGGTATFDGKVTNGYSGALAHVRAYDYALSIDQVTEDYTQERHGYERTSPTNIGGRLYVDLDATQLDELGNSEHCPLYPASLCKPWVRSWSNRGALQGRMHNDVDTMWHYSGSTPLYRQVDGVQALRFMGKDRMVSVWDMRGAITDKPAGTLEAVVYSEAFSPDEVVLEWGNFMLDAKYLKPGWQHVAVTTDGGNSTVYIDGVKAGEIQGALKPGAYDHLNLGGHFDIRRESWFRFFNGAIAQIRVHELPLTADQIAANAKQSLVFTAHTPSPIDDSDVAVARKAAFSWISGKGVTAGEQVSIGEDPTKLTSAGAFKPGDFKPELANGKRYFWRVGNSPIWSFETTKGELISLSAKDLPQGALAAWKNAGTAGGKFVPADRGNLLGMDVESFNGKIGLRLTRGKTMTLKPAAGKLDSLLKGPFTIAINVASDNNTEESPILNWGKNGAEAHLWFGTGAEDRRLITIDNSPGGQLKMIYPEGCNARMAYAWKTITITYADGNAEMWYNNRLIESKKVDLSTTELGDFVLGWSLQNSNGSILLNDLRIYSQVMKKAEIEQIVSGKAVGSPIIRVNADALKAGTRQSVLNNAGSLKGTFTAQPDVDRKPMVKQVNGRNAVAFDGVSMMTSDFILPEALADARPFTVEMWALQDEPSRETHLMAFSQEISDRYTTFNMGSSADSKSIDRRNSAVDWRVSGEEKPGQWVHLAWVYDGGMNANVHLYRDGKLNAEYTYKTIDTLGGYPMSIGGIMSPAMAEKSLFKGAISEVRVFDYPRTAEEIAESAKK